MGKFKFIILLFLISCIKDPVLEIEKTIPEYLIGKWKIVEVYSSEGGEPEEWRVDTTGFEYDIDFKNSGEYFVQADSCNIGNYSVENEIITFVRDCNNSTWEYEIEILTTDTLIVITQIFELVKNKYVKVDS